MNRKHVGAFNVNSLVTLYAPRNQTVARPFSTVSRRQNANAKAQNDIEPNQSRDETKEDGAMARRLSEMTEQAMLEGGRSARKNMREAGFSEDLKRELEERIAGSAFKSEHATAHSIVDMPVSFFLSTAALKPQSPMNVVLIDPKGERRSRNSRYCRSSTVERIGEPSRRYATDAG